MLNSEERSMRFISILVRTNFLKPVMCCKNTRISNGGVVGMESGKRVTLIHSIACCFPGVMSAFCGKLHPTEMQLQSTYQLRDGTWYVLSISFTWHMFVVKACQTKMSSFQDWRNDTTCKPATTTVVQVRMFLRWGMTVLEEWSVVHSEPRGKDSWNVYCFVTEIINVMIIMTPVTIIIITIVIDCNLDCSL